MLEPATRSDVLFFLSPLIEGLPRSSSPASLAPVECGRTYPRSIPSGAAARCRARGRGPSTSSRVPGPGLAKSLGHNETPAESYFSTRRRSTPADDEWSVRV